MGRGTPLSLLLITAAFTMITQTQFCFHPDGSQDTQNAVPCNVGRHSMCCYITPTSPDFCRPDGLCQDSTIDQLVWRESCTDQTWQAPECVKLCVSKSEKKFFVF